MEMIEIGERFAERDFSLSRQWLKPTGFPAVWENITRIINSLQMSENMFRFEGIVLSYIVGIASKSEDYLIFLKNHLLDFELNLRSHIRKKG